MVISRETDGIVLDANPAFLEMTGYTYEEVRGRTATELGIWASEDDRSALRQSLEANGHVQGWEAKFKIRTGDLRKVQISAERLDLDEVPCVLALIQDVTAARDLEEQFRQSQKMEVVGRVAGGISHDFNNLLGVIIGYSEVASGKAADNPGVQESLEQIKAAAERAASLTRQLLMFSRQQILQPMVLNLNDVVENLIKMMTRMIGEDISISFTRDEYAHNVKADIGQVEQIVMNLAVNARDAMPNGGQIHIQTSGVELDEAYATLHLDVTPGRYACLAVSDSGCGMDDKVLARIFDPFFTTKPAGKGTGLGLSTVHGAVKQSGGHIWVYSEPGKGTTFKIYFPMIDEAPAAPIPETTQPSTSTGNETILLAEDDNLLRPLLTGMLESAGYAVVSADCVQQALRIAEEHTGGIDLLLTDIIMPDGYGSKLASSLKQERPDLKVLFMSGYAGELIAKQGFYDLKDPLVQKPFTKVALLASVQEALHRRTINHHDRKVLLLVDDNALLRTLTKQMLSGEEYEFLEAGDGETGLEILLRRNVDVMIADVQLPGLSGFDLVERAANNNKRPRVLFVSGQADHPSSTQMDLGVGFLQKPYSMDDLSRAVRTLLESA